VAHSHEIAFSFAVPTESVAVQLIARRDEVARTADDVRQQESERAKKSASRPVRHTKAPAEELPVYRLPGDGLSMGASLGNHHCWVTTRGRGAVDGFFSTDLGRTVVGAMLVRFSGLGSQVVFSGEHGAPAERDGFVRIRPEEPGEVELHPAYERFNVRLPGRVRVRLTIFVPRSAHRARESGQHTDPAVVYQLVELINEGAEPSALRVYAFAQLRGDTPPDLCMRFNQEHGALVGYNASQPDWVRVFGTTVPLSAYETTTDESQVYRLAQMRQLRNGTECSGGHALGALQVNVDVQPGETRRFAFVVAFSHEGEAAALAKFAAALNAVQALRQTIASYEEAVRPGEVITPDALINEGAQWAKTNMLRVMADYPMGPAFTNDPAHSSSVVGRDAFWFVYGCDHLRDSFSCELLRAFAVRQQQSGKIVEYFDAVTGATEDYGLNINDNTPLFILAANHHWRSSAHRNCVERLYPNVVKAARYIVSQEDDRGLVFCTATGEENHGIIGWRNIIPHYRISGAVTEVNAECAAALRAAGHMADNLGHTDDAREFAAGAAQLKEAINRHLLNPENGLYYLTLDVDGLARTDVTADEVFPVIFHVAPEEVAFRIVSRLNVPDFQTEAGLRTVSAESADYDSGGRWGLLGGVWPGMTWWYAFAASRYHPGIMVQALRASFAHYARAPKVHNTVPGQFSEWFDGESLVNRGMRLSPWEAPRYLWAAIEGICGVMLRPYPEPPQVEPLLPLEWKWVGLRNLVYHGRRISYFGARLGAPGPGAKLATEQAEQLGQDGNLFTQLYASGEIQLVKGHAAETFAEDVSDRVGILNDALRVIAFARPGEIVVCVGNTAHHTSIGGVELDPVLAKGTHYHLHLYNSERGLWTHGDPLEVHELARVALSVESQGFRILRLREMP
jgi:glycogen debranching enzyme